MQARFLLGPAGSGKTFRCLAEIRAALTAAPDGPPLILLAPKQATFQLERQLLADSTLAGYSRLRIFSFERLAEFALESRRVAMPRTLNEEGRVMVLRALLMRHATDLLRFDKSARRPGFAKELSTLLAELQSHGLSHVKLLALCGRKDLPVELQGKLHDLAVLSRAYADWLAAQGLHDSNCLLEFAAEAIRAESKSPSQESRIEISGLWLDGFAEMTPAEVDLLAALLPFCERATLAFCLDHEPHGEDSWLSIWTVVGKSFLRCRERVTGLPGAEVTVELLTRAPAKSRFTNNPTLAHLEASWSQPTAFTHHASRITHLPRLTACANPDAEAAFAAREILKFVRSGGRFREAAVLVRALDGYQKPLERAFRRYGIPFFMDRREGVAHHPLAELTRSALRLVAFDWSHEDWFAALKAGFAPVDETEIDRLENEALARGWRGTKWRSPIQLGDDDAELGAQLERLRKQLIPPFESLAEQLARHHLQPTGQQLAEALRDFWRQARAEEMLEHWSTPDAGQSSVGNQPSAIHSSVWDQMNAWLDNLTLAFPRETLPLRDWLPVLEAGLANLTVGVIPPALDQVLIGAIDRSRNPALKLAFVLGLNEGVFPAAPASPVILTDDDRFKLAGKEVDLGPDLRDRLARERYFGYIACTRPSEQLVLTFARADAEGTKLNASSFVTHLKRLFPELATEEFNQADWREAEHPSELIGMLMQIGAPASGPARFEAEQQHARSETGVPSFPQRPSLAELSVIPAVAELNASLAALRNPSPDEAVSPALAEKLFGPVLKTSVSRLEQFAACPFRFFVHSGLRAEERKVFELDFREQGSFQHDVLQRFHEELQAAHKRWRDITPAEARERVGRIASELMTHYRDGLLRDSAQTRFTAGVLTRALQDFIEVIVSWMHTRYRFDPGAVEVDFAENGTLPAWKLDLGDGAQLLLRGRIDRLDLLREPGADTALCVVMDYKSSAKKLDPLLVQHGVQLQLLSYLNVLRHAPDLRLLGVSRIVPVGAFFVNLRGKHTSGESRAALRNADEARKEAYRHAGRFDLSVLPALDASGDARGEQFNFRLKKDGNPYSNSTEPMPTEAFHALLDQVEFQLREMGKRIFAGEVRVDPYRKGTETPCTFCDYAQVCRIDPWTHEYRVLRREGAEAAPADSD